MSTTVSNTYWKYECWGLRGSYPSEKACQTQLRICKDAYARTKEFFQNYEWNESDATAIKIIITAMDMGLVSKNLSIEEISMLPAFQNSLTISDQLRERIANPGKDRGEWEMVETAKDRLVSTIDTIQSRIYHGWFWQTLPNHLQKMNSKLREMIDCLDDAKREINPTHILLRDEMFFLEKFTNAISRLL